MRKPSSKLRRRGARRGDGVQGTEGVPTQLPTPPPRRPSQPHFGWVLIACLARGRIRADQEARGLRAAVLLQDIASPLRIAASELKKRGATCGQPVKALIREHRRDIDRKNLIATLQTK